MQRRYRVHWKGRSTQAILRGWATQADQGVHTRSFAIKERAEGWLGIVEGSAGCYEAYLEDRLLFEIDFNAIMQQAAAQGNIPAVLEIDQERGVIYVHDATKGNTALRICGLKGERLYPPIDITISALAGAQDVIIAAGGSQE